MNPFKPSTMHHQQSQMVFMCYDSLDFTLAANVYSKQCELTLLILLPYHSIS